MATSTEPTAPTNRVKRLKCAECNSGQVHVVEQWMAYKEFPPESYHISNGVLVITGDGYGSTGDPTGKFEGACEDCNHRWHLRRQVRFDRTDGGF
jgi:hypothetical protein